MLKLFCALILSFAAASPALAAWWNKEWTQRTVFVLDTSATGVAVGEAQLSVSVPLRLHSGNFDFLAAKEDGSDLRVIAGDDKQPLPFRIERFDPANELAVIWVNLPRLEPGSNKNLVHVYAGNAAAAAEAPGRIADADTLAVVHFDDKGNEAADSLGDWKLAAPLSAESNALLGGGAKLGGSALSWPASPRVQVPAGSDATVSMWLRPTALAQGTVLRWGALGVELAADGALTLRVGSASAKAASALLQAGNWQHLAVVMGAGRVRLLLNGAEAALLSQASPGLQGALEVGNGWSGALDELVVAKVARSDAWLQVAVASQGSEGKLLRASKEAGEAAEAGSPGYMGILVKNLTVDAWVIIIILGVMFVHAAWILWTKLRGIARAQRENDEFLGRFRDVPPGALLGLGQGAQHPNSPLFRLYEAGVRELNKRGVGKADARALNGSSIDAVRAAVDADLVRESTRLNSNVVWLTIAISGGPFLGLLGTVVGVMITFAAIAAAGDVNVNAIAPGIAAALLATVAGLGVAIPALFGYNYLASQIKTVSSDMQIFVDEFITRAAEEYGAR